MKNTAFAAFMRLIRWPNLLFIAITQSLFYFCIVLPSFYGGATQQPNILTVPMFVLLCVSSVLIAAAGYIINDYFDLNIDRINKPDRVVVEKIIKRRSAILWHWILSGAGIFIGLYISWRLHNFFIGPANLVCVLLLWFYSTTFKKKLIIGNVIISLLTAWVILVLYMSEFRFHRFVDPAYHFILSRVFKFSILYASFAFIISLIREVIKDIEDLDGDARYGCRTMPVVWGVNAAKLFAGTWIVVLIAALVLVQVYVMQYRWWLNVVYSVIFVIVPLTRALQSLFRAKTTADYHKLSRLIKGIMFTGILSILLLKWYHSWIV